MRVLTDIKRMGGNADVETPPIWTALGFAALVLLIVLGCMLSSCAPAAYADERRVVISGGFISKVSNAGLHAKAANGASVDLNFTDYNGTEVANTGLLMAGGVALGKATATSSDVKVIQQNKTARAANAGLLKNATPQIIPAGSTVTAPAVPKVITP